MSLALKSTIYSTSKGTYEFLLLDLVNIWSINPTYIVHLQFSNSTVIINLTGADSF